MSASWARGRENLFNWSPARLTKLCEGYGDGNTFAVIARDLGCPRSAAIGKFNRIRETADVLLTGRHDDLVTMLEDDLSSGDLTGIAAALRVPVEAVEVRFAEIRRSVTCPVCGERHGSQAI